MLIHSSMVELIGPEGWSQTPCSCSERASVILLVANRFSIPALRLQQFAISFDHFVQSRAKPKPALPHDLKFEVLREFRKCGGAHQAGTKCLKWKHPLYG
jgi:hypothetical protein